MASGVASMTMGDAAGQMSGSEVRAPSSGQFGSVPPVQFMNTPPINRPASNVIFGVIMLFFTVFSIPMVSNKV